jgi:sorting nexin-4
MDIDEDFDDVSWQNDVEQAPPKAQTARKPEETARTNIDRHGKGRAAEPASPRKTMAEAIDLASTLDGILQCSVDSPQKENDGTKDAFISYKVTTHVCSSAFST